MQSSNLEDKDRVDNNMVMVMKRKETGKEEGSKGEGEHIERHQSTETAQCVGSRERLLMTQIGHKWREEHRSGRWCSDYGGCSVSCTGI